MKIKVKPLGIIDRFNGVDVSQTRQYIKISNKTYITKILQHKTFPKEHFNQHPIPMPDDKAYNRKIEEAPPLDTCVLKNMEQKYGYSYRQGVGELIYAMVTCCPDISYPIIKLS